MYRVKKIKTEKEAYLPLLSLSGKSIENLTELLTQTDLYVLTSGSVVVSAALIKLVEDTCEILAITTEESHRAQGFAARLVEYVEDDYIRKATVMRITVRKNSSAPFYRLGFQNKAEEGDQVTLVKDLKALD